MAYCKNVEHIKLLTTITERMTLSSLDISHILYGPNPDNYLKNRNSQNKNYRLFKSILWL